MEWLPCASKHDPGAGPPHPTVCQSRWLSVPFRRACFRACVLYSAGIGILYGVMQKCGVAAGKEFLAADDYCRKLGLFPVTCVDINDSALGRGLVGHLRPTGRNLVYNLLMWMSMPRFVWRNLVYSDKRRPDVLGISLRALFKLPARTWAAFCVAVYYFQRKKPLLCKLLKVLD